MQYRARFMGSTLIALLAIGGCASTGAGGGGDRNVLTRAEIEASSQRFALDLVRAERPHWLRVRGTLSMGGSQPIQVYVDGVRRGTVEELDQISLDNIYEIRYYTGSQAQLKFGVGNVHGAIEVLTRPPS